MSDIALQERIERCAAEGRSFLEKLDGPLNIKDAIALFRAGLITSIYALLIDGVRDLSRQNGIELKIDAKYSEVINALKGFNSEDKITRTAGAYFLSMYCLNTLGGREKMKDSLFSDLVTGVPYAGNILVTILDFENKNSIPKSNY